MRTTAKTSKIKRYMTVVNDTRTADKSTDLLETLLANGKKVGISIWRME